MARKTNGGQGDRPAATIWLGGGGAWVVPLRSSAESPSLIGKLSATSGVGGAATGGLSVAEVRSGLGRIALVAYGVGSGGTITHRHHDPAASATGIACATSTPPQSAPTEDACGWVLQPGRHPRPHHRPLVLQRPTRGIPGATGIRLLWQRRHRHRLHLPDALEHRGGSVGQTTGTYTAVGSIDGESDIIAVSDAREHRQPDHSDQSSPSQRRRAASHHAAAPLCQQAAAAADRTDTRSPAMPRGASPCRLDRWCVRRWAPVRHRHHHRQRCSAYNGSQTVNIVVTAGVSITEPPNPGRIRLPAIADAAHCGGRQHTSFVWTLASLDPLIPPNGDDQRTGLGLPPGRLAASPMPSP